MDPGTTFLRTSSIRNLVSNSIISNNIWRKMTTGKWNILSNGLSHSRVFHNDKNGVSASVSNVCLISYINLSSLLHSFDLSFRAELLKLERKLLNLKLHFLKQWQSSLPTSRTHPSLIHATWWSTAFSAALWVVKRMLKLQTQKTKRLEWNKPKANW